MLVGTRNSPDSNMALYFTLALLTLPAIAYSQFPTTTFFPEEGTTTEQPTIPEDHLCPLNPNNPLAKRRVQEGFEYYDNKTQQCYTAGSQGPCGQYMQWWGESFTSLYGFCSCYTAKDRCTGKLHWPIVRSPKDDLCYPLYDKASCNEGEWLSADENFKGVCTKNPCLSVAEPEINSTVYEQVRSILTGISGRDVPYAKGQTNNFIPVGHHPWELDSPKWYLLNDRCYKTFTPAHCPDPDMIAIFYGTHRTPECRYHSKPYFYNYFCTKIAPPTNAELKCSDPFVRERNDCIPPAELNTTDWTKVKEGMEKETAGGRGGNDDSDLNTA